MIYLNNLKTNKIMKEAVQKAMNDMLNEAFPEPKQKTK